MFIYTLINICKSIGKELWKIQSELVILITSWKITRDTSVLLELFPTIMCLCENELCHYVNSVIVIVSWSLLGRYSGILFRECSCKLFGAVQPWPQDQGHSMLQPGVQPAVMGLHPGFPLATVCAAWVHWSPPWTELLLWGLWSLLQTKESFLSACALWTCRDSEMPVWAHCLRWTGWEPSWLT